MTFLVLGLPRSRTAWLAKCLTYGDHICGHEELRHCRALDDAVKALATAYTAMATALHSAGALT